MKLFPVSLGFVIIYLNIFSSLIQAGALGLIRHPAERYNPTQKRWISLSRGDPVRDGNKLRTGRGGRLELRFAGHRIIRLTENSMLRVIRSDRKDDEGAVQIALRTGRLWGSVLRKKDALHRLAIRTPVAQVAVRGTQLDVEYRKEFAQSRIAVLRGRVEVSPPELRNGPTEIEGPREIEPPREISRRQWLLLIETGQQLFITRGKPPETDEIPESVPRSDWVRFNLERDQLLESE